MSDPRKIGDDLNAIADYSMMVEDRALELPIINDLVKTAQDVDHTPVMDRVPLSEFTYVKNWDTKYGDVKKLVRMRIEAKELYDYAYCEEEDESVLKFKDGGILNHMDPGNSAKIVSLMIQDFTFKLRDKSKLRDLLLSGTSTEDANLQEDDYNGILKANSRALPVLDVSTSHKINKYIIDSWFIEIDGLIVGGAINALGLTYPNDSLTLIEEGATSVGVYNHPNVGLE